jgi:hypothetical protein
VRKSRLIIVAAIGPAILMLSACGDGGSASSAVAPSSSADWVLASEPAGARSVAEIKASAAEGDEVTLRGRIGGRKEPMSAGSPVLTVVDLDLPHCGQNPDDACGTPWDYCCETPDTIAANSATVQLVGRDGRPLDTSPTEHGFSPLDEVVVVGVVGARPDERVLTIRATGMHRVP